jgi:acyl carrier protein
VNYLHTAATAILRRARPALGWAVTVIATTIQGDTLPNAETTADPEAIIIETINTLLARRGASGLEITPEAKLTADLGMDSLELAELSAVLEDEIGRDPYSEGIVPETVGELIGYYEG